MKNIKDAIKSFFKMPPKNNQNNQDQVLFCDSKNENESIILHGFNVLINKGNPYPNMVREHVFFNSPLVELINQAYSVCRRPVNIIDVGASFGDTVFLLHERIKFAIGEILCIEGDNDFYHLLNQNIQQIDNIKTINAILTNDNNLVSGLVKHHPGTASASGAIKQEGKKLDSFYEMFPSVIDILKIDVDGFDGTVLQGASRMLAEFQPWLIFEWHPALIEATKQDKYAAFAALESANYSRFLWFDNTGLFSHFSLLPSKDHIAQLWEYLLKVNHRRDQHYDVIALPNKSQHVDLDLAIMNFARHSAVQSKSS